MNKQQLQKAADTIDAISEHMDMPGVGGNLVAICSSPKTKELHIMTTDNDNEELIDTIASALSLCDDLWDIVSAAVFTASALRIKDSKKDPSQESYWDTDSTAQTAESLRAVKMNFLTNEERVKMAKVEDAVFNYMEETGSGVIKIKLVVEESGLKRSEVEDLMIFANCKKVKVNGVQCMDTAGSLFL